LVVVRSEVLDSWATVELAQSRRERRSRVKGMRKLLSVTASEPEETPLQCEAQRAAGVFAVIVLTMKSDT
jgi:hypothetical protein